jgi:hypothetical protein
MKRAVALAFLLAFSGVLLGDSPGSRGALHESSTILQDLVRMTKAGMADETILAYAKARRAELPPEVSADDLLWLRKSGVSETLVRYMTAIDVRASDAEAGEDVAYDSDEAADRSAAVESYSDRDYGSYPDSSYAGSYPDTSYDAYGPYYNDYPSYAAGYYPYPVYFFVDRNGFFRRIPRHGHRFAGHRERGNGHGRFGHPRSPRGDFDRSLGRHRGSVVAGHRGQGRAAVARGSFAPAFRGPRGAVVRSGGQGHPAFPRGGFGQRPSGPRGAVVRSGGFGRPAFAGGGRSGGGISRGPSAGSGGGRMAVVRPSGNGRR